MKLIELMKQIESTKIRKFKYQNWGKNEENSKYKTNSRIQQWNQSLNEINEAIKEWKKKLKRKVELYLELLKLHQNWRTKLKNKTQMKEKRNLKFDDRIQLRIKNLKLRILILIYNLSPKLILSLEF